MTTKPHFIISARPRRLRLFRNIRAWLRRQALPDVLPTAPVAAEPEPLVIKAPVEQQAPETTYGNHIKWGPRQVKARRLHKMMSNSIQSLSVRRHAAADLLDHKKKSKVSWTSLGLPQDMSKQLEEILNTK